MKGINMTQELVFETDDLKSFQRMLETVCDILYTKEKPVVFLEEPYYWKDGTNYEYNQPFVVPTEDKFLLVKANGSYGGAITLGTKGTFNTLDEAASVSCELATTPKPTRQWICTLENYVTSDQRTKKYVRPKKNELIAVVLELCANTDGEKFLREFFHAEDKYADGASYGYRMEWRPSCAASLLDISMVHVYYGK